MHALFATECKSLDEFASTLSTNAGQVTTTAPQLTTLSTDR